MGGTVACNGVLFDQGQFTGFSSKKKEKVIHERIQGRKGLRSRFMRVFIVLRLR